MPVERVPGIWDYLGQSFSTFATAKTTKDDKKKEEERMAIEQLQRMVQTGSMDSATANAQPIAQKLGMVFQPSRDEMARKMLASPAGQPGTSMPDVGKYFSQPGSIPTGMGGATPPAMGTTVKPWTPQQTAYAGLPSAGQIASDDLAGQKASLSKKYLSGESITPQQASGLGVKTPSQIQADERSAIDPLMKGAAERHVAGILNTSQLDLTDPAKVRRAAATIAKSAYSNYLKEATADGSLAGKTPADLKYAEKFFESAVQEVVKTAEEARLKLRLTREGRGADTDKNYQFYIGTMSQADDFDKQAKALIDATYGGVMATPAQKAQIDQAQKMSTHYRNVAAQFMPEDKRKMLSAGPGGASAATPVTGQEPKVLDLNPEQFRSAKHNMLLIPESERAADLDRRKKFLSDADYLKLKKELQIK